MTLLNLRNPRSIAARLFVAVLALVTLCVTMPHAYGQAQDAPINGTIRGTVLDAEENPVAGAKVAITSKLTGQVANVVTAADGSYTATELSPADYTIQVSHDGFKVLERPANVQAGVITRSDMVLQSSKPLVNIGKATIQTALTGKQIDDLLINGRNFLQLGQLETGVQVQDGVTIDPKKAGFSVLSFGDRLGRTSRLDMDGLNVTDENVGSTTLNIPQESIQEFRMEQSMLDVSTGQTSSGAVHVITKSGTKTYHGQGYYNYRDQKVDADLPGGTSNPFNRSQYGGNFGGALIKDKLFFFIDATRVQQNFRSPVLPVAPFDSLIGSYDSPTREFEGLGRLDWQISEKMKFFYRFAYDQNRTTSSLVPNSFQAFTNDLNTPSNAVGLDFVKGNYTHSLRFGYLRMHDTVNSAAASSSFNPFPGIGLAIGSDPYCLGYSMDAFCSGQSYAAPQASYQSNIQVRYDGSRTMGAHNFRYGAGLNRIQGGGFGSLVGTGPVIGSPASLTGISDPLLYPAVNVVLANGQGFTSERSGFGLSGGGLGPDNRMSFYIGDAFKLRPNFTLNYGVRYDRDSGRLDSDLGAIPALEQFGTGLGERVKNPNLNFAPQLGIAWDPNNSGKTVIRGGIGLFYDNALWNSLQSDRTGRLEQGLFGATQPLCANGAPISLVLPGTTTVIDPSGICGQPIGAVASQIVDIQQQYQAAWAAAGASSNPAYIGNLLADGRGATGTNLLDPDYRTPRSVQMNFGIQHEFRKGTVFSMDYLRNVSTHSLLAVDTNHVGDSTHLDNDAALAALNATVTSAGCTPASGPGASAQNAVNCYLGVVPNASISNFAVNGLDSADEYCGGRPCASLSTPGNPHPAAAFPGANPNLGTNQMLSPIGRSVYTAFQLSLRQQIHNPFRGVRYLNMQVSYTHSSYKSMELTSGLVNNAGDYTNPTFYSGPNSLDRPNQVSFGGTFDLLHSFRLGVVGQFSSPLSQTLTLAPTGQAGGIFVTDVTGDGSGDGTLVSNGTGLGDILPGTDIGSYGRDVKPSNLSNQIQTYNTTFAGKATPAGAALVNAGFFTTAQLSRLGAVMPTVASSPLGQPVMPWLRSLDVNLTWVHTIKDKVEIQPGVSFFNVMNISNFDTPNNLLSGVLNGTVGSINGLSSTQPSNLRAGAGSGVFSLGSPRVLEFSVKLSF